MLYAGLNNAHRFPSMKFFSFAISFLWGAGLFVGWFLAEKISVESLALMRTLRTEHVSIVCFFFVQLLPFVITVLLFRYVSPYCVLPVVLMEAIQYSFCGCLLSLLYGTGSWLVIALVLFTSGLSAPLLLWLWLQRPNVKDHKGRVQAVFTLVLLLLFGGIDYFAISPYWEALLY